MGKSKNNNNSPGVKKPYAKPRTYSYNPEWEKKPEFRGWIRKTSDELIQKGKGEAWCKYCDSSLRAHLDSLKDHLASEKHSNAAKRLVKDSQGRLQPTIGEAFGAKQSEKEQRKIKDIKLSAYTACHTSIKAIDHLGELLKSIGTGSGLQNLRLHRTKCSKIIINVIAPTFLEDIVWDVGTSYYSVIVDESTDVGIQKYVAVLVRYYSYNLKRMVIAFLGLIPLIRQTADALCDAFTAFMRQIGMVLARMIALGTDGAPALCGPHNSLFALLKRNDCPKLQLMRCICHSMDKCSSYASKELPSNLEFMLRETTKWFSHSSIRKHTYEEIFKGLNEGKEPHMLVKLATTRWLAWGNCVARVLDQYQSLKELFAVEAGNEHEKCYTAKTLHAMYQDPTNLLYLTFLRPILRDVNQKSLLFQSNSADITKVYKELRVFVYTLVRKVLKKEVIPEVNSDEVLRGVELAALNEAFKDNHSFLPLDMVKFGDAFDTLVNKLNLPERLVTPVKQRCANFLVRLTKELVERLPTCVEVVERLRFFAPERALALQARPKFQQLPLDLIPDTMDRETIESQWAALGELRLVDIMPEVEDLSTINVEDFWGRVWQLKDAEGEQPYRKLAEYVLTIISLPLSNAVVERIFSIMGVVKTKLRNRMSLKMLAAILLVRAHLGSRDVCCKSFEPSPAMIERFTSATMYDPKPKSRPLGEDENDPDDPDVVEVEQLPNETEENQIFTFEIFDDLDVAEIEIY
ncbi:Zinc finger protein 862 [Frankliniella fusca]|uniref:Zinc finger protein 862 n=1 Tax=Frankliniella fusca TaxID=407009 RepID=A0AAE1LG47_9NEOP|nr:Zinc finger protein 862 [Frankliniella fusca]